MGGNSVYANYDSIDAAYRAVGRQASRETRLSDFMFADAIGYEAMLARRSWLYEMSLALLIVRSRLRQAW